MTEKLLTLQQVADSLGWSYWRVYRSRKDIGAKKHRGKWYVAESVLSDFVATFHQPKEPVINRQPVAATRQTARAPMQYKYVPDPSQWGRG